MIRTKCTTRCTISVLDGTSSSYRDEPFALSMLAQKITPLHHTETENGAFPEKVWFKLPRFRINLNRKEESSERNLANPIHSSI
ncbi:hypothetical protein Mapa_004257 [Marchantia paleacea]|nr:hypothetical protein Mapa_004257 [Marchantia paleacea]